MEEAKERFWQDKVKRNRGRYRKVTYLERKELHRSRKGGKQQIHRIRLADWKTDVLY